MFTDRQESQWRTLRLHPVRRRIHEVLATNKTKTSQMSTCAFDSWSLWCGSGWRLVTLFPGLLQVLTELAANKLTTQRQSGHVILRAGVTFHALTNFYHFAFLEIDYTDESTFHFKHLAVDG